MATTYTFSATQIERIAESTDCPVSLVTRVLSMPTASVESLAEMADCRESAISAIREAATGIGRIETIIRAGVTYERLTERGPRGGRQVAYRTGPGAEYWHPTLEQARRHSGDGIISYDLSWPGKL